MEPVGTVEGERERSNEELDGETSGLRPLLALLAVVAVALLAGWGWGVVAVLSLLAMVVAHELGHLVAAKASGMKATEFFVGFGPRIWSFRRGETEYGLKALPLGGYVRIVGFTATEEVDPADEPRSYRNQAFWKRAVVSGAGSAVHFAIALVLAFSLVLVLGRTVVDGVRIGGIAPIVGGSPAERAGLHAGDTIVAVDGQPVHDADRLVTTLHTSVGTDVRLGVEDAAGHRRTVVVRPVDGTEVLVGNHPYLTAAEAKAAGGPGVIGITNIVVTTARSSIAPLSAVGRSASTVWSITARTTTGILDRFSPTGIANLAHLDLHPSTSTSPAALQNRPTSIVGMVSLTTDAASTGVAPLLDLLIVINVAIGLLNLLPMLPLDGGHLAIAVYERLRTRRGQANYHADITKLIPVVYAFVAVLGFLVLSSVYLDLSHPVPNPFTH